VFFWSAVHFLAIFGGFLLLHVPSDDIRKIARERAAEPEHKQWFLKQPQISECKQKNFPLSLYEVKWAYVLFITVCAACLQVFFSLINKASICRMYVGSLLEFTTFHHTLLAEK